MELGAFSISLREVYPGQRRKGQNQDPLFNVNLEGRDETLQEVLRSVTAVRGRNQTTTVRTVPALQSENIQDKHEVLSLLEEESRKKDFPYSIYKLRAYLSAIYKDPPGPLLLLLHIKKPWYLSRIY